MIESRRCLDYSTYNTQQWCRTFGSVPQNGSVRENLDKLDMSKMAEINGVELLEVFHKMVP